MRGLRWKEDFRAKQRINPNDSKAGMKEEWKRNERGMKEECMSEARIITRFEPGDFKLAFSSPW